jgi:hypothetical protein
VTTTSPFFSSLSALITGASSGIGPKWHLFARDGCLCCCPQPQHARQIGDDLQARYSVTVRIAPKDPLTLPPSRTLSGVAEAGILPDVPEQRGSVSLARSSLTIGPRSRNAAGKHGGGNSLTKLFPPQIRAREGASSRRQHSSIPAGPFMAVYYASKRTS